MKAKAFSLLHALLYLLLFLFSIILTSAFFLLIGRNEMAAPFAAVFSVIALYLIKRKRTADLKECFSVKPISLKSALLIVGMTVAATFLVQSLQLIMPPQYMQQVPQFKLPYGALSIISVAVTSPIAEEVYFRGFILKGLAANFSPAASVIITSFLFSGLHDGAVWGLMAFLISIFYSMLYLKYKTIIAPIIAHLTSNCIALTFNAFALGLR